MFVSGNHDSDSLARELARDGAIVLTRAAAEPDGKRQRPPGRQGRRPARRGLRRPVRAPGGRELRRPLRPHAGRVGGQRFTTWMRSVREPRRRRDGPQPGAAPDALDELDAEGRTKPLTILVGHTHHAELTRRPGATVINAARSAPAGRATCWRTTRSASPACPTVEAVPGPRGRPGHDRPALGLGDGAARAPRRGARAGRREARDRDEVLGVDVQRAVGGDIHLFVERPQLGATRLPAPLRRELRLRLDRRPVALLEERHVLVEAREDPRVGAALEAERDIVGGEQRALVLLAAPQRRRRRTRRRLGQVAPRILNMRPIRPSGVQLTRPIAPPGRQTRTSSSATTWWRGAN